MVILICARVKLFTPTNRVHSNLSHMMLLSQWNHLFRACVKTENSEMQKSDEVSQENR